MMDNKVLCKKCNKCGFINDSSNKVCGNCSTNLSEVEIIVYDSCPKQFIQYCKRCGERNYTDKLETPVKKCFQCGKVFLTPPKEYIKDKKIEENDNNDSNEQLPDQEDKNQDSFIDEIKQKKADIQNLQKQHEESEKDVGWGNILGAQSETKKITLTAKYYGDLSFSIEPDEKKYMLGRSANQREFLSQDRRVGNEHCYLFYQDGEWFVKDNNSKNGTFVNSKDIGINGTHILENGSELKLGHNDNSVAFYIIIE